MQHERPFLRAASPEDGLSEARCFTGKTGAIRNLVREIMQHLARALPDNPELCCNAELVLAEALNNIEEHGYAGIPGMPVQVSVTVLGNTVQVATRDFGTPMPGLTIPPIHRPEVDVPQNALPEGGFGWFLIHSLAPNPSYTRRGNTNRLFFRLRCASAQDQTS
jgi:serine/threonine-protein kinase RsbW